MLVVGFPAAVFGTNCWVLAPGPGEQCVVVDPGGGVLDRLGEIFAEHRLSPAAVVLTHGHLDHTLSVTPLCGSRGIPAYVHGSDVDQLRDPLAWLSQGSREMFAATLRWQEPDDVRPMNDGDVLDLAGVLLRVSHAPGHTAGSVMFGIDDGGDATEGAPVCLSGDVLFAGAIGRTDLRGGSWDAMRTSLRTKVLPLPDATVVLPGHGEPTTIGAERAANPYLVDLRNDDATG